ncbi:hypothetical protein ACIP5Y_33135 [Nocardia sp. NPDC088792]|uniref:hypothetical protein n=1 Tax=Nocardia sp. NPDC088792 TaxID=3364332 RepID=UPI003816E6E6
MPTQEGGQPVPIDPAQPHNPPSWVTTNSAWLNRVTSGVDGSRSDRTGTAGGGRVHDLTVSSPLGAAQKFRRIQDVRELTVSHAPVPVSAQPVVLQDVAGRMPPVLRMPDPELPAKVEQRTAPLPPAPAPIPPAASQPPPSTPFTQMYGLPGEGDPGVPSAKVPKTLEELAIPGYQAPPPPVNPVIQEMISPGPTSPAADSGPKSLFPGVPGLEDQVGIPRPIEVQATASCELPTPVVPGVVPDSITKPATTFRTGFGYTPQQLADDLAIFRQGPVAWVGPGNPYDVARERLEAARYTPLEQRNDLEWAFYEPHNDEERALQQAAFRRLHDAGIQWRDPAVEKYLHDDKTQWLIDPTQPATNTAPSRFSPAEIRRQIIDMNRPDVDPKTFLNDALVDMTIGPAMVLWDAAHDRGDHSGWEITMAAA